MTRTTIADLDLAPDDVVYKPTGTNKASSPVHLDEDCYYLGITENPRARPVSVFGDRRPVCEVCSNEGEIDRVGRGEGHYQSLLAAAKESGQR